MTTTDHEEHPVTIRTRAAAWWKRHIIGTDPTTEPSNLDMLDRALDGEDATTVLDRIADRERNDRTTRECAADEPMTVIAGDTVNDIITELDRREFGSWTPPVGPDADYVRAARRPIDVTDTLTAGGKALAMQRTERMERLSAAVQAAPDISPERRAAAYVYTSALRTRIAAEREARALGESARRVGLDSYAIDCARAMLDRRELAADARAYLATVVLAGYAGVEA